MQADVGRVQQCVLGACVTQGLGVMIMITHDLHLIRFGVQRMACRVQGSGFMNPDQHQGVEK
jgi:hypothetical protein